MCTGVELAMLAMSAAGTVGGTVMSNNAQKSSMADYNNQVTSQNKMLQDQFMDRQRKIKTAQDDQSRVFQNISSMQDEEFAKQTEMARQKQQLFQDSVEKPVMQGMESPEFQDAVSKRNKLFTDTSQQVTADFGANKTGTENRVLREASEKALTDKAEKTGSIVNAQSKLGALNDVNQSQSQLFRDMDVGLRDKAQNSQASSNMLSARMRAPEYRMGALSAVQGEQVNTPYFRGQEPVYRTPNTLFADVLTGAGSLASQAYFRRGSGSTSTAPGTI